MTNKEIFIYKNQLLNQIQYSKIAINSIEQNIANNIDSYLIFFCIQGLLVSLANISKLLSNKISNKSQNRSEGICNILNIDLQKQLPNIANKSLRNTNEHFDERLDEFIELSIKNNLAYNDCCIGTISKNGESAGFYNPNGTYLRHFDNVNKVIIFVDKNFIPCYMKIDDIKEELNILLQATNKWY